VPLRQCQAHNRVCRATSNPPKPSPTPQDPPACPCPRLRRSSIAESGGAAAGSQGELTQACCEISTAHLRSSGLDLIRADLIVTVQFGSGCSGPLPHPRSATGPRQSASTPPGAGPDRSPPPPPSRSLTLSTRLSSLARQRARAPSPADLISVVGFRSNG
jgi:hypothetical protein